jgi:hypothetical protein
VTTVRRSLSHADRTKLQAAVLWVVGLQMETDTTLREPEYVTVTAFQYTFEDILPDIAQDLKTLEDEGAIYSEFGDHDGEDKFLGTFTRYRIKLTPSELVDFVQSTIAAQEFQKTYKRTEDLTAAILAIREPRFRDRVTSYGNYGKSKTKSGDVVDIRGCHASFIGPDLEDLLCGHKPDRYETAPLLGTSSNKNELVISALRSVAVSARKLGDRRNGRPNVAVTSEYDVQDLAELALRAVFPDVEREGWTPQSAGSAKRIDIVIPSSSIVIECKYVRDPTHARKKLADELRIDFESYHEHHACRDLFAYIFDPNNYISDPTYFADSLNGIRQKRDHTFSVYVLIN